MYEEQQVLTTFTVSCRSQW